MAMQFLFSQSIRSASSFGLVAVLIALTCSSGCKQWPNSPQMQQSQMDNERLLSELRAQKKRADETQARLEQAQRRVDEVERLYAKNYNSIPSNRLSSADPNLGRSSSPGLPSTQGSSSVSRSDPKSLEPRSNQTGLGSGLAGTESNRSSSETPKWRPARKGP